MSNRVLVFVKPDPSTWKPEVVFDNSRRSSFIYRVREYDEDRVGVENELFDVAEEDVDAALTQLTRLYPGREVGVFRMEKAAIRPPGDMVTKNVTKDGVLP